jgi:YVTN family beta-propeller protein
VKTSACIHFAAVVLGTHLAAMAQGAAFQPLPQPDCFLSPTALVASGDGKTLFIACAGANYILRFDTANRRVLDSISVPESPSGLALSIDERRLFVTCAAPQSVVCIIDVTQAIQSPASSDSSDRSNVSTPSLGAAAPQSRILARIAAGHTAMAPVLSLDGKTLYVCNRFNNSVGVIDLAAKKAVCRIAVQREPVAADLTKDGRHLLVANYLHTGRADVEDVAAVVSVLDVAAGGGYAG